MNPAVSVLLADDDPVQLEYLESLIQRLRPDWSIVAQLTTAGEIPDAIREHSPSLCILDVRFTDSTGIDVVRSSLETFPVIFVTGDSSYAADAFDCSAIDFLLKPLRAERFEQALTKAEVFLDTQANADIGKPIYRSSSAPRCVRMLRGHELVIAQLEDVKFFQAQRKYTRVIVKDQEGLLRMGLSSVQRYLDPKTFWKIHRGLIVNSRHVLSAKREELGRIVVKIVDRQEKLIVSKPYEYLFRDGFL